jgi:Uma2 family endonuclease
MSRSAVKLTYDDLVLMFPEEDGVRRELIDGELFVTPSPFVPHQRLVQRLALSLGNHFAVHPDQGEVLTAPLDVILTPNDVVEPDLFVVLGHQQEILTDKHVHGAPAIVVEVLSRGTRKRDQTLKRQLFDREGVCEYWMIDPDRNQVAVHRRAADGSFPLARTAAASKGETLTTTLLEGWELAVDQLFR